MRAITPRPVDWIEQAPTRVVVRREVEAPASAVFAVVVDHERWPEWFSVLDSVERTNDVHGVGGTRRVSFKGMTFDEQFVEWEQDRVFGFTVTAVNRPFITSLNERVLIDPLGDDRCRVTYVQGFQFRWWAKPLAALAKGQFRKGLAEGVDGLAARAERAPA